MSQPEMKIDANGTKRWYLGNKLHREDGPALERVDGEKCWFLNDKRHREDGPAIECPDGEKRWYLNDKLHREDGPAIEYSNGAKEWFLNGNRVSWKEVFKKAKTQEIELRILSFVDNLLT
jgi:hypothetical protein